MRAPGFWDAPPDRPGVLARVLSPLSQLWQFAAWLRNRNAAPATVGVPVLCVGNMTAGGAGKTPMVAALMQRLAAADVAAHVVSRGYGGRRAGPHRVDALNDTFGDVGDEPLMLSAFGPVWVARDRVAGARAAAGAGAQMILLDDGYQNPGLHKDAAILLVDAGQGFGNGRIIPAGPLREPVAEGLARAGIVVLVGPPEARARAMQRWPSLAGQPVLGAALAVQQTGLPLAGETVIAFAGIGRPQKFFDTVRGAGANLIAAHAFADHHVYAPAMLRRLIAEARDAGALLVTTEKDTVRIPAALRSEILTVQVTLEPEDWAPIDRMVQGIRAK